MLIGHADPWATACLRWVRVVSAAGLALGLSALPARAAVKGANERILVGVMGTGGRGTGLAGLFENLPGCQVAYVCDVDQKRVENAAAVVAKLKGNTPKTVTDFRKVLDDKNVDVLVVATCNHWHAPAAILACSAGKNVYVEKPCSHNPREGELLVEAARKNKKSVQMGNQRRSWPKIIEGIQKVRDGAIGRAWFAQSWYLANRPTIGKGKAVSVPEGLDYDLWQGPAPRKPFHDNYLHYNWHWFWHWGNGELGNNGIHTLDLCRWGLGVDYPSHVTSSGGRYRFDDDQQTPDTHIVSFNFEDRKTITWEGLSCTQLPSGQGALAIFVGDKGSLTLTDKGYTIHDPKGKEISKETGSGSDALHAGNLLDAIRSGKALNSEIEEAHKSTLLCHLGNIAQRTGRALHCDPKNGHITGDKGAMELWSREYEKGWEPKV
jgi:predicted dehydrogenase